MTWKVLIDVPNRTSSINLCRQWNFDFTRQNMSVENMCRMWLVSTNDHNRMNEDMESIFWIWMSSEGDSVTDFFTAFVLHFHSKEFTNTSYTFGICLCFLKNLCVPLKIEKKKIKTTKYLYRFIVMWKRIWSEIQYK